MTKEMILTCLGDHPWAENLIVLDMVDSTNNYLKTHFDLPHGTVVIADCQTAGRGRLGRTFVSPKGQGLYLSVLLHQKPELRLTPMAAEAVRRGVLLETGIAAQIKWVNDLQCGGKKLCGILTEAAADHVILGIGLNCRGTPHEAAVSLETLGCPVDRSRLAAQVIYQLSSMSEQWMEDYRKHCCTIGQEIAIHQNGTVRRGHADDVDDMGALLVTLPDGQKERIFSGEVTIRQEVIL